MEFIRKRRSIRKFKNKPVPEEVLTLLKEAILRAPTSRGINPWSFIIVDNAEILQKLALSKPHGASFLKQTPLAIVIVADTSKSDVWVEDTSIVATYLQLVAEEQGLGSCWIQIRNRMHNDTLSARDYIANLLNIPSGFDVENIIALGFADETKPPHSQDTLQFEKIFHNRMN